MSHDDVLFGYRLRLFTLAEEIGVRPACRAMGVNHSTYVSPRGTPSGSPPPASQVAAMRKPSDTPA